MPSFRQGLHSTWKSSVRHINAVEEPVKNTSTTFNCLAAAACAAGIASMAACGGSSVSPSSPTPLLLSAAGTGSSGAWHPANRAAGKANVDQFSGAIGGFDYDEPTPPPPEELPPGTITITPAGVSPIAIEIAVGSRVTFVNNDSRAHEMRSDPPPMNTDCPELNVLGVIPPGGRAQTGTFRSARTCGFHDHNEDTNAALVGRIVITEQSPSPRPSPDPPPPSPDPPPPPPPAQGVAPGAPYDLRYTPSDDNPSLSWHAPIDCVSLMAGDPPIMACDPPTGYVIEIGDGPGGTEFVINTGSTLTTYRGPRDGPLDGRGYVRVMAKNDYGISSPSNEVRYDNHGH